MGARLTPQWLTTRAAINMKRLIAKMPIQYSKTYLPSLAMSADKTNAP
jgi:hypothetical protein